MKNHRKLGWIAGLFTATLFMPNLYGQGLEDVQKKLDGILAKAQEKNRFVGLSILAIDKDKGSFKKHYGFRDLARTQKPNDDTIYEIGSITKVFTRLALLAQDKIKPDDLLSKHLPEGVRVPKPHGQEITIKQLMTHTGTFRYSIPCVQRAANPGTPVCFGVDLTPGHRNPYAKGSKALTYEYVTAFSHMAEELPHLVAKPGDYREYSNTALGLLGNLMEDAHGQTLHQLMVQSIFSPLGMTRSSVSTPCAGDKSCENFAWPHQIKDDLSAWQPWDVWKLPGLAGAGAMHSSLADMEKFLRANMDTPSSPLPELLAEGQRALPELSAQLKANLCKEGQKHDEDLCNPFPYQIHKAWEILPFDSSTFFHNGGTGGSSSMLLFSADRKKGVIVLSNASFFQKHPHLGLQLGLFTGLCLQQLLDGMNEDSRFCKALTE